MALTKRAKTWHTHFFVYGTKHIKRRKNNVQKKAR
jgi:hypothetical protein